MKSEKITSIAVALGLLLTLIFIASGVRSIISTGFTTQIATNQTVLDTVDADFFIVRDESYIIGADKYTAVPLAENAGRIAKGSAVAAYFATETAAENYASISSLSRKLSSYETIDRQLSLANVDMDKLNDAVSEAFSDLIYSAYEDDYSSFSDEKLEFLEKLSLKQISMGELIDCTATVEGLRKQVASLAASSNPVAIASADTSGYFVSECDGYESVYTTETLESISVGNFSDYLNEQPGDIPANCIGKVMSGYKWYLVTCLKNSDIAPLSPGAATKIVLGESSSDALNVTVHSISNTVDGENVIVFSCNLMNSEIASLRKTSGKLVIREYSGLKVSKDAIRVNSTGENGVYIIRGNIVNYRSINIVYYDDKFVIVVEVTDPEEKKKKNFSAPQLSLYDEIIVSGKDIYDGMVIG